MTVIAGYVQLLSMTEDPKLRQPLRTQHIFPREHDRSELLRLFPDLGKQLR